MRVMSPQKKKSSHTTSSQSHSPNLNLRDVSMPRVLERRQEKGVKVLTLQFGREKQPDKMTREQMLSIKQMAKKITLGLIQQKLKI